MRKDAKWNFLRLSTQTIFLQGADGHCKSARSIAACRRPKSPKSTPYYRKTQKPTEICWVNCLVSRFATPPWFQYSAAYNSYSLIFESILFLSSHPSFVIFFVKNSTNTIAKSRPYADCIVDDACNAKPNQQRRREESEDAIRLLRKMLWRNHRMQWKWSASQTASERAIEIVVRQFVSILASNKEKSQISMEYAKRRRALCVQNNRPKNWSGKWNERNLFQLCCCCSDNETRRCIYSAFFWGFFFIKWRKQRSEYSINCICFHRFCYWLFHYSFPLPLPRPGYQPSLAS